MFRHDKADFYGTYNSKDLVYKGEFHENQFNGKGVQKGCNYQYNGTFEMGSRLKGTLVWTENQDEFTFKGSFNSSS